MTSTYYSCFGSVNSQYIKDSVETLRYLKRNKIATVTALMNYSPDARVWNGMFCRACCSLAPAVARPVSLPGFGMLLSRCYMRP